MSADDLGTDAAAAKKRLSEDDEDTEGHAARAVRAFEPEGAGGRGAPRATGDDDDVEGHMGGTGARRAIDAEGIGKAARADGGDDDDVEGHARKR